MLFNNQMFHKSCESLSAEELASAIEEVADRRQQLMEQDRRYRKLEDQLNDLLLQAQEAEIEAELWAEEQRMMY